ncbi:MAG: hypothetical protein A3G33_00195 [Omnitrophica bacterium RIFCSPLOWO2_12_FULL_44_17]|uniref:Uncharacterized protein n=1 Tax=Candidatus Danuiimicrobium aquiferis TaxID=1801832 RepID=A0A1G1KTF3_9BACT|nr:MAG: hypothetical protein A3B72_00280 [Omnitrophica bacterium RIFCSPHIGHO2_02_FULL_45_28]OGW96218.1 MAG: hypothetical protein A3G33_00195 [Omnitrophica bacterium RIFCSPLOWO2_12_FULL_44_17]OGX02130.1 MAG: hypothetical protein A3J12_01775 [Omnitrophica bacterium RIFCSPLOWO2_02_FULL_44_11]
MNEHFKDDTSSVSPQAEPNVMTAIKKIQEQLGFLEKKIDILIKQSSERPFKENHFSKPFRPGGFGPPRYHARGGRDDRPRENSFSQERRFDKRHSGGNRGFGQQEKQFFPRRKGRN